MVRKQQYFLKQVCPSRQKKKFHRHIPHCFLISKHTESSILLPTLTAVSGCSLTDVQEPHAIAGTLKVSPCSARNRSRRISASSKSCSPKRALPKPNPSFADTRVLKGHWLQRIFLGHLCWSGALQRVSNHSWVGWGCSLSPLTRGGSSSNSKPVPSQGWLPSHSHSWQMCWASGKLLKDPGTCLALFGKGGGVLHPAPFFLFGFLGCFHD